MSIKNLPVYLTAYGLKSTRPAVIINTISYSCKDEEGDRWRILSDPGLVQAGNAVRKLALRSSLIEGAAERLKRVEPRKSLSSLYWEEQALFFYLHASYAAEIG
jgi:hypothetical protein